MLITMFYMISLLTVLINNGQSKRRSTKQALGTIPLELPDIATVTTEVDRVQNKLRRLETARAQKKYECECLLAEIKLMKTPPASQSTMIQSIMMKTPPNTPPTGQSTMIKLIMMTTPPKKPAAGQVTMIKANYDYNTTEDAACRSICND